MKPHGRYSDRGRRHPSRPATPMPLGKQCNPLCPFFKCSKNALVVVNKVVKGHVQKVAMCRWIGDQCLGVKCQFAFCERRALLPDGTCAFAIRFRESGDEFLKEVEKESLDNRVRDLLSRRVGRRETFAD